MKTFLESYIMSRRSTSTVSFNTYICCSIGNTGERDNMRINKMTYEELVKMKTSVAELPFYVTRKVGTELKVYAYSHSSMTTGNIHTPQTATYNPLPYKGRYGVGFTVTTTTSASTPYAYVTYYIELDHSVICSSNAACTLCPLYTTAGPNENCLY